MDQFEVAFFGEDIDHFAQQVLDGAVIRSGDPNLLVILA
jgi:hypothetical protein